MGNVFVRLEPTARASRSSCARTSTRCRRPTRSSRSSRTGRAECAADDPRRRQQGGGRGDARGDAPPRSPRTGRTRGSSSSSRRRRRSACSAPTRSTTRASGRARLRLRPGGSVRRGHPRRALGAATRDHLPRRAAHAGMYPEEGRSAIAAAARAISEMRLGRIDEETTANIGEIRGGTAANIVPEWCSLVAEARSHDDASSPTSSRDAGRGDVRGRRRRVRGRDDDQAQLPRLPLREAIRRRARGRRARALRLRPGYPCPGAPRCERLQRARPQCVNLANGMAEIHTPDETSPSLTSRRWSR